MVKQYLAAVLEDLIGEYVLNISKENLKFAALKGKIKLDNVELDGDYIGSHVISAIGLQGFGVLSCHAKSLEIHVPWKNLDEPTSLEIHGMHLVCVPLLPTTAARMYYGGGISGGSSASQSKFHDETSRCSLRTRAKRSAIARFERNFFSGRIPGEGPQIEKEQSDNRTVSYNGRRQRCSLSVRDDQDVFSVSDNSVYNFSAGSTLDGSDQNSDESSATSKQTLKEKITTKIYQNLISSINDVHLRFEVPEGALDINLNGKRDRGTNRRTNHRNSLNVSDQKAFAFGVILQRLSVQNVLEDVNSIQSAEANLKDKSCKTIKIDNMSVYWDDGPSFLLTESDSIKGLFFVPMHKLQKRIADVMKNMSTRQDPGEDLRIKLNSLNSPARIHFARKRSKSNDFRTHEFICTNISQTIHTTFTTEISGNTSFLVDILPSKIVFDATSKQYRQYQLLKNAVLSQQRFDTMLHGRPTCSPLEDPKSWWRYVIKCVQHRPNSRPWSDVLQIVQCRPKYISLVIKNLENEADQSGFHGGLSRSESQALLEMEGFLPIETLLAYHLLALRAVYNRRRVEKNTIYSAKKTGSLSRRKRNNSLSRLWKSFSGTKTSSAWKPLEEFEVSSKPKFLGSSDSNCRILPRQIESTTQNDIIDDSHTDPTSQTKYRLQHCQLQISLTDFPKRTKIVAVDLEFGGISFNSGQDSEEYVFDIFHFEVLNCMTNGSTSKNKVLCVKPVLKTQHNDEWEEATVVERDETLGSTSGHDGSMPMRVSSTMSSIEDPLYVMMHDGPDDLLPDGVVCRVNAVGNCDDLSISFIAHPATIVWNNDCADAVADYFYTSTPDVQFRFLNQLRSVATPEAHRRQMELLFPTSLHLKIDVHAPKLWLPVSSSISDGALYLDAGRLRMGAIKPAKTSNTRWGFELNEIQIKFLREDESTRQTKPTETHSVDLAAVNRLGNGITIVHPFHISVAGIALEGVAIPFEDSMSLGTSSFVDKPKESISGEVSVTVGSIRLNLVDVEVLAKAVGRFYAAQIIRLKTKAAEKLSTKTLYDLQLDQAHKSKVPIEALLSYETTVCFERIEVALETYSKANLRSNRTYLTAIQRLILQQRSNGLKQFARLAIRDISIAQLLEIKQGRRRILRPSGKLQHQILGRKGRGEKTKDEHKNIISDKSVIKAPLTPETKPRHSPLAAPNEFRQTSMHHEVAEEFPSFITACHYHDGEKHVDEVEFDVTDVLVRVTPTSILDIRRATTRLLELVQLASKEMERKVHAGRRDKSRTQKSQSHSMSLSEDEQQNLGKTAPTDSSIIYRVTFQGATLMVGRPASEFISRASKRGTAPHDYVIQVLTNASLLVQSIENADSSGSKAVHLSCQDLSASISDSWVASGYVASNQFLSPSEVDARAVYRTVEEGLVVSQDFSFDCESLKFCMLSHDITVVLSIARKVVEKLSVKGEQGEDKRNMGFLPALIHAKEKGSGVATDIRFELNSCSIVSMHSFRRSFLDLQTNTLKLRLHGVLSCLAGELSTILKLSFCHPISGWEHVVEPVHIHVDTQQMPDEQVYTAKSDMININFTSHLLDELASMNRSHKHTSPEYDTPSQRVESITFTNCTGIDISISLEPSVNPDRSEPQETFVRNGGSVSLEEVYQHVPFESSTISLRATKRAALPKLPFKSMSDRPVLYKWHSSTNDAHELEPVVEYVVQNQRLRSNVSDVFSLDRGTDLLSSAIWSPDFKSTHDILSKHIWQKPYLDDDPPEYSDMTCRLKQTKESILLPPGWMWANDWEVEVNNQDADGWEYSADFETFNAERRFYKRGDACRRRTWTRHRIFISPGEENSYRLVWELNRDDNGCTAIKARSHISLKNTTSMVISIFAWSVSWHEDKFVCSIDPGSTADIPIQLASATSHIRIAVSKEDSYENHAPKQNTADYAVSDRVMILPSAFNSNRVCRATIRSHSTTTDRQGLKALRNLHFVLSLSCFDGVCHVDIKPALTVINLLPCELQCQLGESVGRRTGLKRKQVVQTEETSIGAGNEAKCISVDCRLKPHISVRLPGFRWSAWNRIVNRHANSQTWLPLTDEQATLFDAQKDDAEHANEFKTIIHLDSKCTGGSCINLIMSVDAGHSPTVRVYAQYWILDKSGLGLRFSDSFDGIIGQTPDPVSLRQSFLALNMASSNALASDMKRQGCEWSIGMNGMTFYFSKKERVSFSIVHDEEVSSQQKRRPSKTRASHWSAFIDISKAMPKTVISVNDNNGKTKFELAYDVTICPSLFSRTLQITFYPRYQIANLLNQDINVAQDGASEHRLIPSQSWLPFHWDDCTLAPKIRLSRQIDGKPILWTKGCIALDRIGITAIRMPTLECDKTQVVQVEVRLATKKQMCSHFILIWSSSEKETSNPLYILRNDSMHSIFCCQPLRDSGKDDTVSSYNCVSTSDDIDAEQVQHDEPAGALNRIARRHRLAATSKSSQTNVKSIFKELFRGECDGCIISDQVNGEGEGEFVWNLMPGQSMDFGFDNPELPHTIEWTCLTSNALLLHGESSDVACIDIDIIGSSSSVASLDGDKVKCEIKVEQSTKVVAFSDAGTCVGVRDDELASLALRIDVPGINISFIESIGQNTAPRELILLTTEGWMCNMSQTRESIHEFEVRLDSIQADNFIFNAEHQVLIFAPKIENEPFVHCSIVRRLSEHESTFFISYAALRVLEFDISLDRKTAEALAQFLSPLRTARERDVDIKAWISSVTHKMSSNYSKKSRKAPRDVEKMVYTANSSRVYIENLQLHPIKLSLTFTQEYLDSSAAATEGLIIFQLIRGTASIADAPLTFTSFLVGNAFESLQQLRQIIVAHYSSQLTSQILPLLFNMAILKAPVEFVSNVGSGVVRFFYEPINALVYSPEKFVEGLEAGTHHLARGVFTGFVKGAANLTYLLNNNLVSLASDEVYADTRRAFQRQIESTRSRTMEDSLIVAGGCISRGFHSGTAGIFEQPAMHASRHGTVGLVTGVGKALVGAVVKPVVGVGDAAVVIMNHVGDAASEKVIVAKETKRMRRALPKILTPVGSSVKLIPYDSISAKAQRIVTGGESVDDTYLGHVTITSHLIIASTQCLWTIDADSRDIWCIRWTEISHFSKDGNCLTITFFSSQGPHSYVFSMAPTELEEFHALLSMQTHKMGNMNALGTMSYSHLPGVKSPQTAHIFGSININYKVQPMDLDSDARLVERCRSRVSVLSSSNPDFFIRLDQEAWLLVNSSTQLFTGLSSRRCVCIGILNGANETVQLKSAKLIEGGSRCYIIPSREYDKQQGTLEPGGAVIIFGWGAAPSLLQPGRVLISVETNAFSCLVSDRKGQETTIHSLAGYQIGLLERSNDEDESGWWAKYWILIRKD